MTTTARPGRPRLNLVLYLLVLVLAVACVVGGVHAWQVHQERDRTAQEQQRYGAVKQAASGLAEAFINIDYRKTEQSTKAVAARATGDFKKQYEGTTSEFVKVVKQNESVMQGEVLWAGVTNLDSDSATVLVATSGTVANKQTDGDPMARNFRLQVSLVRKDGEWLANNLQFVG